MSRKSRTLRLRLIEGQIGEVAYQLTKVHFSQFQGTASYWSPNVNVFQCAHCLRICAELAGVCGEDITVDVGPGSVRISGHRNPPEPLQQQDSAFTTNRKPVRVIAMEIDHGNFEREIEIPEGYDYRRVKTEWGDGLLWIYIPRIAHA